MRSHTIIDFLFSLDHPQLVWLGLLVLAITLVFSFLRFHLKLSQSSQFKLREADRLKQGTYKNSEPDPLANSKLKSPLQLPGFQPKVPPHEVLGVSRSASASEIQTAYREMMKRYHPDRVGRPGSSEWKDAQEIAARITEARDELLSSIKS